jgi:3-isopropylmalate/(R)-2-methylmalate dehydratase small subunit
MQPFTTLTGIAIPFGRANVDTDIIMPARWLKKIQRTGLGIGAFEAIRADPANIFDTARNKGAPILIAGPNFGGGSSREHAAWAIADLGIRAIIGPDFADIFSGNAFKNGILLAALPQAAIDRLMEVAPHQELSIDLPSQTVSISAAEAFSFPIDADRKNCLLNGLDEIALTLALSADLDRYESDLAQKRPWNTHQGARR